jgi:hypothetical protein
MSFGKNRSGLPYLKTEMPRVLLPGEPDITAFQEKEEALNAFWETAKDDDWRVRPRHGKCV